MFRGEVESNLFVYAPTPRRLEAGIRARPDP
jgi:hypothetical protein